MSNLVVNFAVAFRRFEAIVSCNQCTCYQVKYPKCVYIELDTLPPYLLLMIALSCY